MKYDFYRVAAATPQIRVADPAYNAQAVTRLIDRAAAKGAEVLVCPELCLTGYTCADLFHQPVLLAAAADALKTVAAYTLGKDLLVFVGLPVQYGGKLYNTAAALYGGRLLGLIPKTHLPNYGEFYEQRNFVSGRGLCAELTLIGQTVPLCDRLLFVRKGTPLTVGAEICEDLWAPVPPSCGAAAAGATVIVNLSASSETAGKAEYRRLLVTGQSARLLCGYAYADAGRGESSTDATYSGHNLVGENGALLAESAPFADGWAISEIDVGRLVYERGKNSTFAFDAEGWHTVEYGSESAQTELPLTRNIARLPFVPAGDGLNERAQLILNIQTQGLAQRLAHTGAKCAVLGVSGGLDSSLALLVTARAFDLLGLPREKILAVTMPGFGTTGRTYNNALTLIRAVGAAEKTIDITAAAKGHLSDIGHDGITGNVTYENAQARMRTLILMDLANLAGGIVVGTGDLSELALGWATYNGDHMSMYGVNASVPKTLVKSLIAAEARRVGGALETVLTDVLRTEISPELLPPDASGKIGQKTEELVGPYELTDFFLYWGIRWGCPPQKVLYLARQAFDGAYDAKTILRWLKTFYKRFFAQQFKRSCLPDGVKVGSVSLSPRGDWRMPSDAVAAAWLKELES